MRHLEFFIIFFEHLLSASPLKSPGQVPLGPIDAKWLQFGLIHLELLEGTTQIGLGLTAVEGDWLPQSHQLLVTLLSNVDAFAELHRGDKGKWDHCLNTELAVWRERRGAPLIRNPDLRVALLKQ